MNALLFLELLAKRFHTLYIPLPQDIHAKLLKLYKNISQKYNNQYLDENNFKAHLTIGVLSLGDVYTDSFVANCVTLLKDEKSFELVLADFVQSSNRKYIFLDLDAISTKKISDLHDRFLEQMRTINKVTIPQKYLDTWSTFSVREKELLKLTGMPYEFQPHISIVKLSPEESTKALQEATKISLVGTSFEVTEFCVSCQSDDLENQFPVIKRIHLGE